MIDWEKANIEDFDFKVEGETIIESGNSIVFPVHVYYKDGTSAFLKPVSIRTEFYYGLKKTADWKEALMKIFRQRVRDDLAERFKHRPVPVEDKIELIDLDKQPLKDN